MINNVNNVRLICPRPVQGLVQIFVHETEPDGLESGYVAD